MKYNLAIMELISGLLGWGWIIASIVAVYFLVMAIGFDGKWSSFFWAFGVGAIAKWLFRGFDENTRRIAGEAQTIDIMSSKNEQEADRRMQVISDFGAYLESNPTGGDIRDASELPHQKEEILSAILLELILEEDENRRSALEAGAIYLADFQEGVGSVPLSPLGISAEQMLQSLDSNEDAIKMAERIANNPNRWEYESFKAMADEELTQIRVKIAKVREDSVALPNGIIDNRT